MAGTDLVVIGAGPGGYVAAIRAAQLGMKVVIAEKDACGGTCLNYGCIPTKALYKNAQVMGYMDRSREFGIEIDGYRLDMEQVQARKNKIVKTLTGGVEYLLKSNKVAIEKGCAKIIKAGLVEVTGKDGTVKRLETKRILIASGSKSSRLPIEGMDLEGVITSKEALDMKTVPEEIVIIGGGVIGIEFAGIYQSFGAKVTVVEFMPHIIPNVDVEITARLKSLLEKRGISIMTGSKVEKIEKKGNNLSVQVDAGGKKQVLSCGQVLVSTGREMDADGLNLDGAGVRYDRKGIKVDENYETNVPGIYAIGDVTGRVMLAHVASEEGKTAVERMAGEKTEVGLQPDSQFHFYISGCVQHRVIGRTGKGAGNRIYYQQIPVLRQRQGPYHGGRRGYGEGDCRKRQIQAVRGTYHRPQCKRSDCGGSYCNERNVYGGGGSRCHARAPHAFRGL